MLTVDVFWSDEDGGFIAADRANPSTSGFGDSEEEALRQFSVAIGLVRAWEDDQPEAQKKKGGE
jgi:predicted RNase H-like HicB family nuclease